MADISQITLPDGTTYDIKDPVARAAAGDAGAGKIFYGVCSTAAATQTKVVTIDDFELFTGALIAVKFENVNTATAPKLNISGTGAINMYSVGTTAVLPNAWVAGETLLFVYNGTSYMVADGGIASTSGYGATKLNSSTSSTSTTEAATPSAVKSAYDLALEAKTSASDGKTLIASAITGKGVSTSATDTFSIMASNIDSIQTGHTITVNGEEYDDDISIGYGYGYFSEYSKSYPPGFNYYYNRSIFHSFKQYLYVVGCESAAASGTSYSTSYYKRFIRWDGNSWTSLASLPFAACGGHKSFFEDENYLYVFFSTAPTSKQICCYRYDGTSWTSYISAELSDTVDSDNIEEVIDINCSFKHNGNWYVCANYYTSTPYIREKVFKYDGSKWIVADEFLSTYVYSTSKYYSQGKSGPYYHSNYIYLDGKLHYVDSWNNYKIRAFFISNGSITMYDENLATYANTDTGLHNGRKCFWLELYNGFIFLANSGRYGSSDYLQPDSSGLLYDGVSWNNKIAPPNSFIKSDTNSYNNERWGFLTWNDELYYLYNSTTTGSTGYPVWLKYHFSYAIK